MSRTPPPDWCQAKDGSWHPFRLVDVRCPRCGLEGGAPAGVDRTSCPRCGTGFAVPVEAPAPAGPPEAPAGPPESVPTPESDPTAESAPPSAGQPTWATTLIAVAIAAAVIVIGAARGQPSPAPLFESMHFCTSGSAPTVDITLTVGTTTTTLAHVANGHCAQKALFPPGSTLVVEVHNTTGVGEVDCTIVRNGRTIDRAASTLRSKPATCRGRA